jgi:hypothetical protein
MPRLMQVLRDHVFWILNGRLSRTQLLQAKMFVLDTNNSTLIAPCLIGPWQNVACLKDSMYQHLHKLIQLN